MAKLDGDDIDTLAQAFVRAWAAVGFPVGRPDRTHEPPGWGYARRVGDALSGTYLKQVKLLENCWSGLVEGKVNPKGMLTSWVNIVESLGTVNTELMRGSSFIPRPAWLSFKYAVRVDPNGKPIEPVLEGVAKLESADTQAVTLERSDFVCLSGGRALPAGDTYNTVELLTGGREIRIRLNQKTIKAEADRRRAAGESAGSYLSFVTAQARGPEQPLVLVMLEIAP